ncbi:hypothetical protein SDC9_53876 [bioreactor metagenome]|uniref:Uncharacterized protein n=1 Tax=bioreactor metagenome TaxID=1076179 RepID=A0A644WUL0_9ZZZZ
MIEFVRDDRVFGTQEGLKQATVCVETGRIQNGVIGSYEIGNLALQSFVQFLGAADKAHARQAKAPAVIAFLCRGNQFGIGIQAEIIICAHIQNMFSLCGIDKGALRRRNDAFILIGPCRTDFVQSVFKLRQSAFHSRFLPVKIYIFNSSSPKRPCRSSRCSLPQNPFQNRGNGSGE